MPSAAHPRRLPERRRSPEASSSTVPAEARGEDSISLQPGSAENPHSTLSSRLNVLYARRAASTSRRVPTPSPPGRGTEVAGNAFKAAAGAVRPVDPGLADWLRLAFHG
ncbi:MAG: hypothetical protein QXW94_02165 [Desulfurococcaceae archaeon]